MQQKAAIKADTKLHKNRSLGGDFYMPKTGYLVLSDGSKWKGQMPAWQNQNYFGEVVFNTGMTGYVESLTDPSYAGQILVFTYPLIGNYGVQLKDVESDKIQVSGVVVAAAATGQGNVDSDISFLEWLGDQKIPLLSGVDTRDLTKHLRVRGTMAGSIGARQNAVKDTVLQKKFVSILEPIVYNQQNTKTVILVDCGAKQNILRSLLKLPIKVKRVPYDYDYTDEPYDGVLLSNGPGNPVDYHSTIAITKKALDNNRPVFGICLGGQIMGLAAGAKTYKLKFGHRGHNQPCLQNSTNHAYITSQNHGFAVAEKTLPTGWIVNFRNLNDGTVEGIEHARKPFFAVQFHPESCPGPTDTAWLFERFYYSL